MSNTSAKLRAARLLMLVLGAAGMLACRAAGEPRPGGATVAPHSEQLRSELEQFDAVPAHRERRAVALAVGVGLIERYLPRAARQAAAL